MRKVLYILVLIGFAIGIGKISAYTDLSQDTF